ncbi:MAG: STAS domain-containing protein [Nocardioidaceae bacterium]|nr:STAS domain-containing protein [Nocardioidaceae bacterium]
MRGALVLVQSMDDARPGQHLCQMYDDEQELRAAVCAFVRAGLAADELVLYVTGSDAATVTAYLADGGVDGDTAYRRGQIRVVSVAEDDVDAAGSRAGGVVDRLTAILAERQAQGFAAARMASEVDLLFGEETQEEMVERERLGGGLVAAHPVAGLCLYDRRRHETDFLVRAAAVHAGQVVPEGDYYRDDVLAIGRLDGGDGLRVSGQVDLSNRGALEDALAATVLSGTGEIVVDLAGASFLDVGAIRVLAESAWRHPGRRVVLRAPATSIQRSLRLVGWDQLPNMVVDGGDGSHGRTT